MGSWSIRVGVAGGVVAMMLGGCASKPPVAAAAYVSPERIVEGMRAGGARTPVGAPVELEKKTKAKVAGATALRVASSLFGGRNYYRTGPRNEMPTEGYVDLSASPTMFEAEEMLGFADPGLAMTEGLSRQLTRSGVQVGGDGRYSIMPKVQAWGLDYDRMGEQDNYRLYYQVDTTVSDGESNVRYSICRGVSQDKRGLDEWLANDNAEVRRAAARIGGLCAQKLLTDLGLGNPPEPASLAGQ